MTLTRIEKQSAESQVAEAVREHILSGQLSPGSRVTEAYLSEQFGLSRATVRGALQRVSQEGLIRLEPYSGWEVIRITSHDAWELYTLRSSMEALAARLVCASLTDSKKAMLEAAYADLLQACNLRENRALARADWNLHRTIVEMSGHERLIEWYRVVQQQIALYINWSDYIPKYDVYERVPVHHGPIVESILARDADTAARLSSEHNIAAGEKLVAHLKQLERQGSAVGSPEFR